MAIAKRQKTEEKKPFYEVVAERLIKQLEENNAPWQKPWVAGTTMIPHNPVSGTRYKGGNALWLAMQGRTDPRWMTYKQAKSVDAQVMKGESGTLVQYWKFQDQVPKKDANGKPEVDANGKKKMITVALDKPKVFSAVVFNAEQIQGLPPIEKKEPAWDRHDRAEKLLRSLGVPIHHDQADNAFYRPSVDSIHLPRPEQFESADAYYATALHEEGHASGHKSRLDRDLTGRFGSESYAKEELRAEIASMLIGDELEIGHDPGQHAAYVKSWIKVLKEDPKEILRAAKDAESIYNYILSHEKEQAAQKSDTETPQEAAEGSNNANPEPSKATPLKLAEKLAESLPNDADKEKFMERVQAKLSNPSPSPDRQTKQKPAQVKQAGFDFER